MKITVLAGRNGSGKTQYVEQLRRQIASDKVRYIAFSDSYGPNVDGQYYLQLRWNQHDIDHEMPTAGELLQRSYLLTGEDTAERRQLRARLYDLFDIGPLLDKYIITLSSGELRKFQLTKTLFADPRLLIMDNPFIGLDAETRDQLRELLRTLATERDMELMLVLSKTDDIPEYVTDVRWFPEKTEGPDGPVLAAEKREAILSLPAHDNDYQCQRVIDMRHVTIRYGKRTILRDLDWTVMNGERWALTGQNGSGKSTLLSLVCADNPQSYACDITLFDRPRGSGESIWDIKRHIGYVSPEMHRSYKRNLPAIRIVASGLMDSVGLYAVPDRKDYDKCRWWMSIFGIADLADRPFLQLSSGEQRLVLLARAFVKDPQLLILDEPLHGLDLWNRRLAKDVIETFCQRPGKTMIMVTHYQEELPDCITDKLTLARNL
ncbi:MAG: ATP-binding cassette domain-containing protein [Prevotella sp.]|nr:ATP-binding cassette domain-containing protein [Prevotella sp.]MBQ9203286.1 ATP-binding cassette domain-containing protein [Prevotella sp.]